MSNFLLRCLAAPGPIPLSACPLHGAPMDRRSLLDTVTTLSVSGRFDFFCVLSLFYEISESVAHALKSAL